MKKRLSAATTGTQISAQLHSNLNRSEGSRYRDHFFTGLETLEDRFMLSAGSPLLSSPALLAATVQGTSGVQLSWIDTDPSATGYYVLRSVNGHAFSRIKTITSARTTSFVDTRVSPSQTYRYEIEAFDAVATSVPTTFGTVTMPLGTPTSLAATCSGTSINLNWRDVDSTVKGYAIYRSVDGAMATLLKSLTTNTKSFADKSVTSGHAYTYTVSAVSSSRTSALSNLANHVTPIAAPSGLAASVNGTAIFLSWTDKDTAATGYYVLRSVDGGAFSRYAAIPTSDATSYADSSVPSHHTYAYKVQAYDVITTSAVSASRFVSVALSTPAGLAVTATSSSVSLTWAPIDANASGVYVFRSTDGTTFTRLATISGNTTIKHTDSTVAAGKTYEYVLQAFRKNVVSAKSSMLTVTTPVTTTLASPTGLTATVSAGSVSLRWTNSDLATTGFLVMRSTDGGAYTQVTQIASATTTTWVDSAAAAGHGYYYEVMATNGATKSSASNVAQATIPADGASSGVVTITTRFGNELVITATDASDTIKLDQNGAFLIIIADDQTYTYSVPAAGVFVYTRGGNDSITTTTALTVRTTIVSVDGAATTVTSAGANVSAWIDSTDAYTGTGYIHRIDTYAGGVSKAVGTSLADPTDSGTTKKVTLSMWGTGPVANDERQGAVGDCYFLATLASLANTNPTRLQESAVDMGDGTYVVQYFTYGQQAFVRVNNDFSVGGFSGGLQYANLGANNVIWAMVMEKAWTYFRTGANTYASTSSGWMGSVFTALNIANSDKVTSSYTESSFYALISGALSTGHAVTGACYGGSDLVNGHAYSIMSASKDANGVTHYVVRNPWGCAGTSSENSQGYATLTFAQMLVDLTYISMAV